MHRILAIVCTIACIAAVDDSTAGAGRTRQVHRTDSLCLDSVAGTGIDLAYFKAMASSTNPKDTIIRHGLLPPVAAAAVTYVTDTSLCRRAAESSRRSRFGADTGVLVPVELFQFGSTRLLGSAPARAGDGNVWIVFDTTFAIVGAIISP